MQIIAFCICLPIVNINKTTTTMTTKLLLLIAVVSSIIVGCTNSNNKTNDSTELNGDLIIFHAGSLAIPFKQAVAEFNKMHPKVNFLLESSGSVKCARKITDLNKPCDIMASADYTVINEMLIPDYTSWNIKFASNEMCIVYHDASRYGNEITQDNWHEILMKDDVIYGRSDPNSDPCGYRAVLVSQLAETHYKATGFSKRMIEKNAKYVRPKETDLLALLETNTIDYIFLYRSVAQQHGLKYLILPNEINLKKTEHAEFYRTSEVDINGKKPGEKITKRGEPMVYGFTVLNEAPNKIVAVEFAKFMLSKENGMAIMEENGQPSMVPSISASYSNIPEELKQFAKNN